MRHGVAMFLGILGFLCVFSGSEALIIPDEVPSLLSLIYSNIPTLKKGTDSRIGWGFRLGDRADFQVLVELGPQTNTQPLANQGGSGNSKRNVGHNVINTLYAQRQRQKDKFSDTEGGKFLEQWGKDMSASQNSEYFPIQSEPTRLSLGIGEVDAKDVIPDDSVLKLEELYGKKPVVKVTTEKPKSTTSYKDALDNVDLD